MNETIKIPAVLRKDQLGVVVLLKGYANDAAIAIGGRPLEAGHAVFQGFRDGEVNHRDHLFYGDMHFEIHDEPSEALRDDLEPLLEFAVEQSGKAASDVRPALLGSDPEPNDSGESEETISRDDDDDNGDQ